jgi:hypothetical protein
MNLQFIIAIDFEIGCRTNLSILRRIRVKDSSGNPFLGLFLPKKDCSE